MGHKPIKFPTLSCLVDEFITEYGQIGHKVQKIVIGLSFPAYEQSESNDPLMPSCLIPKDSDAALDKQVPWHIVSVPTKVENYKQFIDNFGNQLATLDAEWSKSATIACIDGFEWDERPELFVPKRINDEPSQPKKIINESTSPVAVTAVVPPES